jgi:hypothetical protein
MDLEWLHNDIRSSLPKDEIASKHLQDTSNLNWRLEDGLLWHKAKIYVPDVNDLQLQVLKYKHDHILSGHFGQNKTIQLLWQTYT